MSTFEEETKKACENCKQLFPESKVQLHEAYCLRNIRKCPNCEQYVDKREMEEHQEEFHKQVTCEKCGKTVENQTLMQKHIDTQCSLRPRECRYCNVLFPIQEFEQHEYICGCRTKVCGLCKKNILMRDYENHMDTCVGIVEEDKKPEKIETKPKASLPFNNQQASQNAQQNKPVNVNQSVPSTYPKNSINQIIKNEREQNKNDQEQQLIGLKKKKEEEDGERAQIKNQFQKESLNKPNSVPYQASSQNQIQQQQQQQKLYQPSSQSSKTNIQSQQQQRNPIPTNNQVLNSLEKNKIPNEPKPQIAPISSQSKQQSTSYGQQQVQQNPIRSTQQQEKQLVEKYGIKPPSSQGQRQPLVANKQDLPSLNKINSQGIQNQQQQQQPISTYQMRQDDIYGSGLNSKAEKDPYLQKREDQKLNNNIYNNKMSSNISDASKQKREDERLREMNELPTQGYYDNLKTIKNPSYEYKNIEQPTQDKYQQKYSNVNNPTNSQARTNITAEQKPNISNNYADKNQKPIISPQYQVPGQNPQTKPKQPTVEKPSISSQSSSYQPSLANQKQLPPKGQIDYNQPSSKNPPPGYKNHDEILRNVPSQGISGIPNYQPLTKPTSYPQTSQTSSNQNQRVPSRGKYDEKPTYPMSSQQNPILKKQTTSSSNKQEYNGIDDDDELQKAIQMSYQQQQDKQNKMQPNSRQNLQKPVVQQSKQYGNEQKLKNNDAGLVNEDEEIQRAIMESIKGNKQPSNSTKYSQEKQGGYKPSQQQYNKYGGMGDDEIYDEEMEKAILQSLKK
ncbi:hypothetical protein ABPG74_000912 [Tetrahymena malaccensis]